MAVEIKAVLKVDDAASATLDHVKKGMEGTADATKKASGAMDFFKQTLSTIIGMNFVGAIRGVADFATSFVDAAREGGKFDKSIAALISTVDGVSFEKAKEQAEVFAGQLDDLSVDVGIAGREIESAFKKLTEIRGAGSGDMQSIVGEVTSLSQISRVLGKDLESITAEYGMMAEGMVRPKGQMFQLLQSVGTFGRDSKKARVEWALLTETDRMTMLQEGVGKIAEKFQKIPMGFGDYMKSIKNLLDLTKEDIGKPLLKALGPVAKGLRDSVRELKPEMIVLGEAVGKEAGRLLKQAAEWIKEALKYVVAHKSEIVAAIEGAAKRIKEVVDLILRNKELIAMAVGAKVAGPSALAALGPGIGVAKSVYQMGAAGSPGLAAGAAGYVGKISGAIPVGGSLGASGVAAAGGAAALGAFAAAIGGVALAAWQGVKLYDEITDNDKANVLARKEALDKLIESGGGYTVMTDQIRDRTAEMATAFEKEAEKIGMSAAQARQYTEQALAQVDAQQALLRPVQEAADYFADLEASMQRAAEMGSMGTMPEDIIGGIAQSFEAARSVANIGMQRHVAAILAGSVSMQGAFLESAKLTSEGYAALAELLPDSAGDFKKKVLAKAAEGTPTTTEKKGPLNMYGGQTFKVQQDFRDQDPDRVAILFQRDLMAAATRRVQAGTAGAFGT